MKHSSASPANSPGWTFSITLWILGLVAAFQLLAFIWKVVPATILQVATAPTARMQEQEIAEAFRPAAPLPGPPQVAEEAVESAIDPVRMQEAMTFVEQADRDGRVGNWEGVLMASGKALEILGPVPEILLQQAFALGRLGREAEGNQLLQEILSRPDLDPQIRAQAVQLRDFFSQTLSNMESKGIAASAAVEEPETPVGLGGPVVEAIGLQPGASLGIVDVREMEAEDRQTLRIAIKSRPDTTITSSDVKVMVYFFEKGPEGEVFLTDSPVTSEWISPPVDWGDNEPEIIDVIYATPKEAPGGNIFHGYIVAIYFRDELQDTRAVPGGLDQQFPPALFLENTP